MKAFCPVCNHPLPPVIDGTAKTACCPQCGFNPQADTLDNDPLSPEMLVSDLWAETLDEDAGPKASLAVEGKADAMPQRRRRIAAGLQSRPESDAYEVFEELGKGGMGIVYSARQKSIDRVIALKVLRREGRPATRKIDKFMLEAMVTGELEHPNIVPIYDLCRNENGDVFYAMKRVKGETWGDRIQALSLEENLEVLMRVADAVAFAHSKDIIHRDLKPDNVMLGEFGEVILTDWGLAASMTADGKAEGITSATAGTPSYMAPEMALGHADRIGPCSDIYLLGAMLFEIIAERPPHMGKDVLAVLKAAAANAITPTNVEGELMDIALRAMATDPAARFPTVQAFQKAIQAYRNHQESWLLFGKAQHNLTEAQATGGYDSFAKALFGLMEAVDLWPELPGGTESVAKARLAYAECAYANGDLDLALSLLHRDDPLHASLHATVESAAQARSDHERRLQRTIRVTTAMLFVLLVMLPIVAGVVLTITYRHSQETLQEYADQLIDQVAATTQEQVDGFLLPARDGAALSQRIVASGLVEAASIRDMEVYFADFLRVHPAAAMFNYGDQRGNFLMVRRQPDDSLSTKLVHRAYDKHGRETSVRTVWRHRTVQAPLSQYREEPSPEDRYDPRVRPWYTYWSDRVARGEKLARVRQVHWTDPYVFYTGRRPGITASVPHLRPDGTLQGVLSVDVTLDTLSQFLAELRIGSSGKAFILDERRRLVAVPDVAGLTVMERQADGTEKPALRHLGASTIPALASLAQAPAFKAAVESKALRERLQLHYEHADREYLATLVPIKGEVGSGWLIGVVVAEDDLLGQIKKNTEFTTWTIGSIMVLAIMLAVVLAHIMLRSLRQLQRRTGSG